MISKLVSLEQLSLKNEFDPHWLAHTFMWPCVTCKLNLENHHNYIVIEKGRGGDR